MIETVSFGQRFEGGGKGWTGGTHTVLRCKIILCEIIMVDTCHYAFVKTKELCNSKCEYKELPIVNNNVSILIH